MKKAVIVFHSVCGNDFLVAQRLSDELRKKGVDASMYRVADPGWVEKPDVPDAALEILRSMRQVPEVSTDILLSADLVIMGSPTYFGNVTGQMKTFMDMTGGIWFQGKLTGKKFAAFTSAGHPDGGADLCLQALRTYASYMGMLPVPVPVTTLPGRDVCVSGIIHYSFGKYARELDVRTVSLIAGFADFLKSAI